MIRGKLDNWRWKSTANRNGRTPLSHTNVNRLPITRIVDSHGQNTHNTEEKEDETQASPSSSPAPRYSSPTLVDSSSPPDMDVQLSVKLDDILNKYPSTRVFMSEVRNLRFLPSFPCASCRPCLNSPSFLVITERFTGGVFFKYFYLN